MNFGIFGPAGKLPLTQVRGWFRSFMLAPSLTSARISLGAPADSDVLLAGCRVAKLMNSGQPNYCTNYAAMVFVMQNGAIRTCGAASKLRGVGPAYISPVPEIIALPFGYLGKPISALVAGGTLAIVSDQSDVALVGLGGAGEIGNNAAADVTVAALLDATSIGPRSGIVGRTIIELSSTGPGCATDTTQTFFARCADNSMWFWGANTKGQGADGTVTNRNVPTRCQKIAGDLTSATSIAIGTGSKSFTTQSGKSWVANDPITIVSGASNANRMVGTVTSYSGTSLVVNVTAVFGSGTFTDWQISAVVNDCAAISASGGGAFGSSGYRSTAGLVRLAGHLIGGASARVGSGVAAIDQIAFKPVHDHADNALSALPAGYVCTKLIVMGTDRDICVVGLLCSDFNLYLAGRNTEGEHGIGDLTTTRDYLVQAASGTGVAATFAAHVSNFWIIGNFGLTVLASLDSGAFYGWGYGSEYLPPIAATPSANNSTPTAAIGSLAGAPNVVKVMCGDSFATSTRCIAIALDISGKAHVWGSYRCGDGGARVANATPAQVLEPHKGQDSPPALIDVMASGGNGTGWYTLHYDNGECFQWAGSDVVAGNMLGVGHVNVVNAPARVRF